MVILGMRRMLKIVLTSAKYIHYAHVLHSSPFYSFFTKLRYDHTKQILCRQRRPNTKYNHWRLKTVLLRGVHAARVHWIKHTCGL